MAKKHKGGKHEKARKTAADPTPRTPAKAAKRIRSAKPRPAEPELIVILEPELEPEAHGVHAVEDVFVEDVLVEDVLVEAPRAPYRSVPQLFEPMPSPDWEADFAYQCAEEQVALAMLEAEQAVALCQGYDHLDPYHFFDASSGPDSSGRKTLPSLASQPRSTHSMERDSDDEPFAFDHI